MVKRDFVDTIIADQPTDTTTAGRLLAFAARRDYSAGIRITSPPDGRNIITVSGYLRVQ